MCVLQLSYGGLLEETGATEGHTLFCSSAMENLSDNDPICCVLEHKGI